MLRLLVLVAHRLSLKIGRVRGGRVRRVAAAVAVAVAVAFAWGHAVLASGGGKREKFTKIQLDVVVLSSPLVGGQLARGPLRPFTSAATRPGYSCRAIGGRDDRDDQAESSPRPHKCAALILEGKWQLNQPDQINR